MNYEEKKNKLIEENNKLMMEYKKIFSQVLIVAKLMQDIDDSMLTPPEQLDWFKFANSNPDMDKFIRLCGVLEYVENPYDKEVVSNLLNNIEVSNIKSKLK